MATETHSKVKDITYIAIGIACLIVGGFTIFQLSLTIPIPGIKYILMSPYLSMVIYILLSRVKGKTSLLRFGCTFGFIMMVMNPYMGMTIILTTILSQVAISLLSPSRRPFFGAVLFSGFAGVSALLISKYIIGGVFSEISLATVIYTGTICAVFGVIGTLLAKKMISHMNKHIFE